MHHLYNKIVFNKKIFVRLMENMKIYKRQAKSLVHKYNFIFFNINIIIFRLC